jgi:hypothetical protein
LCRFEYPCPGVTGEKIKSIQMNKRIKNILRCYAAGIGIKETASTFHISRNTVRKYVRLFLSSGKSIEQLLSLPNGQLDELFGCTDTRHREPSSKRIELEALLPGYVSRLSRKGMSVRKLFKEYHTEYPDGYQLSSFKRIVSEYRFHIKVVGHVEHYAAEQMYIDFAGDRLEVVDEMTGETKKSEVFVAILPFSHYYLLRSRMVATQGRPDKGMRECHSIF